MDGNFTKDSFGMARGSLLRIDDGAGTLLHVWEGEVWLTQEGSRQDHMLGAGQSFLLDRPGAVLAQAFRRSLVSLSAPGSATAARRVRLIGMQAGQPEEAMDVGLVMAA